MKNNNQLETPNRKSLRDILGGLAIFDSDRWQEIWQTISHNKFRSFLTGFGVFWGMFMLVVMVGAGIALQRGMQSQIEGFATNSCFVSSGTTSEPYKGFKKGRNWDIVYEDIAVLDFYIKYDLNQKSNQQSSAISSKENAVWLKE